MRKNLFDLGQRCSQSIMYKIIGLLFYKGTVDGGKDNICIFVRIIIVGLLMLGKLL